MHLCSVAETWASLEPAAHFGAAHLMAPMVGVKVPATHAVHAVCFGDGLYRPLAQAVQTLQQQCPKARVVYCSATGASSLGNMAYMERLGIWGVGTAFATFAEYEKAIGDSGVGAMELVALDMKRRGMYISRQLSFKVATYDQMIVDLTPRQEAMYDGAAQFWQEMHGCFDTALRLLDDVNGTHGATANVPPTLRAAHPEWFSL